MINMPKYPAVTLTFKTTRARESFVRYLQQVTDGRVSNPDVALAMSLLTQPAVKHDTEVEQVEE